MNFLNLNTGIKIPQLGIGTWQMIGREDIRNVLIDSYELGYRLIDTAAAYSNEILIGKNLKELSTPREELFISGKVWNTCRGYEKVQIACKKSLKKLKLDQFDLYLIHWPASKRLYENWSEINSETWRGMEALVRDGLVLNIGVCNFNESYLEALFKTANILPAVNQFEIHPGMYQKDIIDFCQERNIVVEASSPLGNGKILDNVVLKNIALKHNKSVAQICLRWAVEKNIVVIPKTCNYKRLKENRELFDFTLNRDEVMLIDQIEYCGGLNINPEEVTEFG